MRLTLAAALSAMLLATPGWATEMKTGVGADECATQWPGNAEIQPEAEGREDALAAPDGENTQGLWREEPSVVTPPADALEEPRDEIAARDSDEESLRSGAESDESLEDARLAPGEFDVAATHIPADQLDVA